MDRDDDLDWFDGELSEGDELREAAPAREEGSARARAGIAVRGRSGRPVRGIDDLIIETLTIIPEVCRAPFLSCVDVEAQLASPNDPKASWRTRLERYGLDAWSVAGRTDLTDKQKARVHELREEIRGAILG